MTDVHVMVDCETWGTAPVSALRSIAAVTFDPCGDECFAEDVFYCNIDRASCEAAGLNVDPETERWWSEQAQEARDALLHDPWTLSYAASMFDAWWTGKQATHLWCNGACFDEPILRVAFGVIGRRIPWKFWNVRDTRTIWDIGGVNPKNVPREGAAHNALADARHQAKCVTMAYVKLKLGPPVMIAPAEMAQHSDLMRPGAIVFDVNGS